MTAQCSDALKTNEELHFCYFLLLLSLHIYEMEPFQLRQEFLPEAETFSTHMDTSLFLISAGCGSTRVFQQILFAIVA